MTGFKKRLTILASTLVAGTQPLHAQVPVRDNRPIVLRGIITPQTETISVRPVCFGRAFSFTIVNQKFKASELVDARADGATKPTAQSIAELRQFLAGVRNIHFGSSQCISENEIDISLIGLLRSPPPGKSDDVLRFFKIHFPAVTTGK